MATLVLTRLWLNLLADGTALAAYSQPGRARSTSRTGEVRTYAGGRRRSFTTEGVTTGYTTTLVDLTLAQVQTLESWIGQVVQVRDHRGQRHYGVYYTVAVTEQRDTGYTAGIQVEAVTVGDEG
jgi:hypothetical protein